MQFIPLKDQAEASSILAKRIAQSLSGGKALWLVCGGSNIPLSVAAMNEIRATVSEKALENLTVALTDERYGPVGHVDSNWQQLVDAGFNFSHIRAVPILIGKSVQDTVAEYATKLETEFSKKPVVIAQFGIGGDGHIGGVLPHTIGVSDEHTICAHNAPPFERITLTLHAFKNISIAYAFVFGAAKHDVVSRLKNESLPLADMPSQILKQVPEADLYSDQLE
jgi:6-phosphogluconolactonase/glucosamine-6-phosphate isomerase/deaminase